MAVGALALALQRVRDCWRDKHVPVAHCAACFGSIGVTRWQGRKPALSVTTCAASHALNGMRDHRHLLRIDVTDRAGVNLTSSVAGWKRGSAALLVALHAIAVPLYWMPDLRRSAWQRPMARLTGIVEASIVVLWHRPN